jgi:hypothetical protein
MMEKERPYSEKKARAEVRAALQDLERGTARLRDVQKRLEALPSWGRANAAIEQGDDYATSFAWNLWASCDETAGRLEEEDIPHLQSDLRQTDETLQAASREREAESNAGREMLQHAPPPRPPESLPPGTAALLGNTASVVRMLASLLIRIPDPGESRAVRVNMAKALRRLANALRAVSEEAAAAQKCSPAA